jgi:ArsR family transcriptional regulator, arsenate/arsenite/antimonite-responsive transcriptional repressor
VKKTQPSLPSLDLIFRAFADRTRLRILYLLQGGECCVGNIVDIIDIEQPSASRHLAYLRRAGLVAVRKDRQWSYYSLAPAREPFHQKLLECLSCCFSQVPEIQEDQRRAREVKEFGGCCPEEVQDVSRKTRAARDKSKECCS